MTITVSFSQFRQHMADYINHTRKGYTIALKDKKRGEIIAEVIPKKKFDPEAFKAMLDRVAGTISAKDHPEWATPKKIDKWLRKTRKQAERHFDVPSRH